MGSRAGRQVGRRAATDEHEQAGKWGVADTLYLTLGLPSSRPLCYLPRPPHHSYCCWLHTCRQWRRCRPWAQRSLPGARHMGCRSSGPRGAHVGVLCAADDRMATVLAQTETFVPVMHVVEFDALADAIARNNAVPQGLASYPWTRDVRSRRPPEREAVAGP